MIRIKKVNKVYGQEHVLKDVDLTFASGGIHGIIGRNGSGKTVLMKCICGLIPVTSGEIIIDKKKIGRDIEMPESLGLIIETPGFLPNYSGFRNLIFLAGIKNEIGEREIKSAMKVVGLDPESRKWVSKYSLGMRQRLAIAQAIMEDPTLLVLDEPMNGLDDAGVRDMRTLFSRLRKKGKTILLASHSAEDIDALCDTVTLMEAGKAERIK